MGKNELKLFVGGLDWGTSEQRLREEFGKYGAVSFARVSVEKDTYVHGGE